MVANEWAFCPGYPMLVRAVMETTDLGFAPAVTIVSLVCAGLAVVLLYRMLAQEGDSFVALTAVLGLCTFPAAPILQLGYTESLALLLIVLALVTLRQRMYGRLAALAVALSLTRPVVLPLAIIIGVHWLVRWRRARVEPFPLNERLLSAVVAIFSLCLAGLWPAVAAVATGDPHAYTKTHAAWPANSGHRGLFGNWVVLALTEGGHIAVFVAIAILVVGGLALRSGARNWGLELRVWSVVYPVYVLVATRPTTALLRHMMLTIGPLWPFPDGRPSEETPTQKRVRWMMPVAFALVGLVGQYLWVTEVFTIADSPELRPLP